MFFPSQARALFTVEHCLAPRSYLSWQCVGNKFPDLPLSNKPTISRLVNRIRNTKALHWVAWNTTKRMNEWMHAESGGHFQHLTIKSFFFLFSIFIVIYFLTDESVKNGLGDFSITLYHNLQLWYKILECYVQSNQCSPLFQKTNSAKKHLVLYYMYSEKRIWLISTSSVICSIR